MDRPAFVEPRGGPEDRQKQPRILSSRLIFEFIRNARDRPGGLLMLKMSARKNLTAILSLLTIGAALSFGVARAAEDVTEDQILRALAPAGPAATTRPVTRGLSVGPQTQTEPAANPAEGQFVQKIRNRSTRSLSAEEREEIATIVKDKPKIDLEINFDYNSANISSKSLPSVQALGRALSNPSLKGSTFVVAGHTDAAGGDSYNQDLSERRADSIKRYLVSKFGIAGADLVTVGYGKTKLKDPANPMAEVNRRVQVVNMNNKATASN
jgi:outer membrane protein OmpA-like peptidoglycan-associated protein